MAFFNRWVVSFSPILFCVDKTTFLIILSPEDCPILSLYAFPTNSRMRVSNSATAAFVNVTINISEIGILFSNINRKVNIAIEYVLPVPALASIRLLPFISTVSTLNRAITILF